MPNCSPFLGPEDSEKVPYETKRYMGISLPWRDSHTEFNCDVFALEIFIARANENAI